MYLYLANIVFLDILTTCGLLYLLKHMTTIHVLRYRKEPLSARKWLVKQTLVIHQ